MKGEILLACWIGKRVCPPYGGAVGKRCILDPAVGSPMWRVSPLQKRPRLPRVDFLFPQVPRVFVGGMCWGGYPTVGLGLPRYCCREMFGLAVCPGRSVTFVRGSLAV